MDKRKKKNKYLIPRGTTVVNLTEGFNLVSSKDFTVFTYQEKNNQVYYKVKNQLFRVSKFRLTLLTFLFIFLLFPGISKSCSRDINELTPETQEKYNELKRRASRYYVTFIPTCTYRTQKDQDKLYAKGRTEDGKKVTWTRQSRHTERIAFDIAVLKGRRLSWKAEDYSIFKRLSKELNLVWGGNWKIRDYGHFELRK